MFDKTYVQCNLSLSFIWDLVVVVFCKMRCFPNEKLFSYGNNRLPFICFAQDTVSGPLTSTAPMPLSLANWKPAPLHFI